MLEDVAITYITMRDVISAPIFLRLGSRMRAPQGRPVGTLKRVIISNIVCSNSVSKIASIIGGIPGHSIEDVNVGDIYNPNRGGGTKEMASIHVVGFRVGPSRPIADTKIDHADHRSL